MINLFETLLGPPADGMEWLAYLFNATFIFIIIMYIFEFFKSLISKW